MPRLTREGVIPHRVRLDLRFSLWVGNVVMKWDAARSLLERPCPTPPWSPSPRVLNRRLPFAVPRLVAAPVSRQYQPVIAASSAYRLDVIGCPRQWMRPYQFGVDEPMALPADVAFG
jgi:hypothetical protein